MRQSIERFPAQGTDASQILINDHNIIKRLLDELVSAGDMRSCTATFEQLKQLLTLHNATEENIVYPALAKFAGEDSEALQLYHDTADADVLVFELDLAMQQADERVLITQAKKLRGAVHEHMNVEETIALPHLLECVGLEDGKNLTNTMKTFRDGLAFRPPANSW